jgi:hypothetical protein
VSRVVEGRADQRSIAVQFDDVAEGGARSGNRRGELLLLDPARAALANT